MRARGSTPVISGERGRKRRTGHDELRYRERSRIEATFECLQDFVAARPDKRARNYASALALALAFGC